MRKMVNGEYFDLTQEEIDALEQERKQIEAEEKAHQNKVEKKRNTMASAIEKISSSAGLSEEEKEMMQRSLNGR